MSWSIYFVSLTLEEILNEDLNKNTVGIHMILNLRSLRNTETDISQWFIVYGCENF